MQFKDFTEFYIYYLNAHTNLICRRFHFIGTCAVIALMILFFFTGKIMVLGFIPLVAYGFSWAGHFLFEKNSPLSFRHPLYTLRGDFAMFWDILWGRLRAF